jgi:endonuclease/exonuclease/phosphatase family metal-dependent hydrolase
VKVGVPKRFDVVASEAHSAELEVVKRGSFAREEAAAPEQVRVLVWNLERGRALDRWLAIDAVRRADVLLLCEVDDGMARSGNLDICAELAERLGKHYAFVPNYFELTRGTRWERIATRGENNARGLHGNAILSRWPLHDVRRVPLPMAFDWFRHYERRIGTRVALRATIRDLGAPLTVAVAHLEAFAAPAERARQMRVLVQSLDDAPRAIVGGDFNTLGVFPDLRGVMRLLRERARDEYRLTKSVTDYEPLFEDARRAGFSWRDLNAASATWRYSRLLPSSLEVKLDWLLGRQVRAEPGSPAVVAPQVLGRSRAARRLSDHDGLCVSVRV